MAEQQLNEHGMLLHATPGCLFDGRRGHVANSRSIQVMAVRYGWKGEAAMGEDDEDFNEATDEAMAYLNQHAVAEGFEIAWHEGDVMVLALSPDEDDEQDFSNPFTNGDIQVMGLGEFLDREIGPEKLGDGRQNEDFLDSNPT